MKRPLFFIFSALGAFILLSILILPEYRLRTLLLMAVYVLIYSFVFKSLVLENLRSFMGLFFKKRSRTILLLAVSAIMMLCVALLVFSSASLKRLRYQSGTNKALSFSRQQKEYIRDQIKGDYDVIYIKNVQGHDESALFNSLMQELSLYSKDVRYEVLHPVSQADKYSEIKKELPSLLYGNVVVIGKDRAVLAESISSYDLINAIYRARTGLNAVCVMQGHDEISVDDMSEEGAGIMAQMLRDRGITLVRAELKHLDSCPASIIIEPKKEFSGPELNLLKSYRGGLLLVGGTKLSSVKTLLTSKGISVSSLPVDSMSQGSSRDYFGGILLDKVYKHPATAYVKTPPVASKLYEVSCDACDVIASSGPKDVLVMKDSFVLFSGEALCSNFFMRFKGNSQLLFGLLSHACCGSDAIVPPQDESPDSARLFAVSPRYLDLIFAVCVFVLPLLFLALGIYCFRSNRG